MSCVWWIGNSCSCARHGGLRESMSSCTYSWPRQEVVWEISSTLRPHCSRYAWLDKLLSQPGCFDFPLPGVEPRFLGRPACSLVTMCNPDRSFIRGACSLLLSSQRWYHLCRSWSGRCWSNENYLLWQTCRCSLILSGSSLDRGTDFWLGGCMKMVVRRQMPEYYFEVGHDCLFFRRQCFVIYFHAVIRRYIIT